LKLWTDCSCAISFSADNRLAYSNEVPSASAFRNCVNDGDLIETVLGLDEQLLHIFHLLDLHATFAQPERPQGIERNIVITLWDWSRPTAYLHDEISTDRRNPRVNANGKIYASTEDSTDFIPVLDPKTNTATEVLHPVRDPNTPSSKNNPFGPSAYWGAEPIWDSKTLDHNPMMDEKGRIWFTSRIRPSKNPDFCKQGSDHPSAKAFPIEQADRHLSMYEPATGKFTVIGTCFPTHHLNFAGDANQTLWLSGGLGDPGVIGWLNRKMFEETGDEVKSQGWTPFILDTVVGYPGQIVRVQPGSNPTETALSEIYEVPLPGLSSCRLPELRFTQRVNNSQRLPLTNPRHCPPLRKNSARRTSSMAWLACCMMWNLS
jgi:hypothetical protein